MQDLTDFENLLALVTSGYMHGSREMNRCLMRMAETYFRLIKDFKDNK